ncbi:MAG: DUF3108 domain-containing protein [Magnetococcales bacterium]|nr:DUF3108 domain-containing protein [Magnetococcales bacterium]
MKRILQLTLVWVALTTGAGMAWCAPQESARLLSLGAAPGEHLRFNVHWMGVPAGAAYMQVRPALAGEYSLAAGVESIGVVKLVHAIKDSLQSDGFLTPNGFSARYFIKQQQRRDHTRILSYRFDREWGEVVRTQSGEEPTHIGGVTPQVNDLVAGFFALRACRGLVPGANLYVPMVDGKKVYEITAAVGNPERLQTPLGWFDVLPVTVVVGNSDLFRLQGSVVVWLTSDPRRIPVRVESRIEFKKVSADLVFLDDGRGDRRELKVSE